MIVTDIRFRLYNKKDIDVIKNIIIREQPSSPVFIYETNRFIDINFEADYEHWEINEKIEAEFSDYYFTDDPEDGNVEIRIQLSRQQPPYSTDGWGRPIQDPLDETKYLVKPTNNSTNENPKFNPTVKVLFGEEKEREYFVNVVPGISEPSNKKGYLILNEFTELVKNRDVELLENTLFETPS